MDDSVALDYLRDASATFQDYKTLAEKALDQVADKDFFRHLDTESNSVAVIVKHMSGNMISRWRDFLTSDGEKPDRRRDTEFTIEPQEDREAIMARWESAWAVLFDALDPLVPGDLRRSVRIRGERHSVVEAINRQVTHYAYHIGQIVFLAKHFRSDSWRSLSIPKDQSEQFIAYVKKRGDGDQIKRSRFDTVHEYAQALEDGPESDTD